MFCTKAGLVSWIYYNCKNLWYHKCITAIISRSLVLPVQALHLNKLHKNLRKLYFPRSKSQAYKFQNTSFLKDFWNILAHIYICQIREKKCYSRVEKPSVSLCKTTMSDEFFSLSQLLRTLLSNGRYSSPWRALKNVSKVVERLTKRQVRKLLTILQISRSHVIQLLNSGIFCEHASTNLVLSSFKCNNQMILLSESLIPS